MKKKFNWLSLILIVLVVISIVLSYSIWKGQPNYESIDVKEVQKTTIDKTMTTSQVFRPIGIQANIDNAHYATTEAKVVDSLVAKGRDFNFSEVVASGKKSDSEYDQIIHQNGTVELVYPNNIPFAIFSQIFAIQGKDLDSASFDRIVFDMNNTTTNLHPVYFANDDEQMIYQSTLQQQNMDDVIEAVNNAKSDNQLTKLNEVDSGSHKIYLSDNQPEINSETYIIDSIDIGLFTKALFPDSESVKNEDNSYTDGSSKIVLDTENKVLDYINPAQEITDTNSFTKQKEASMIQDSFNFINEHAGWTGDYYYTGFNQRTGMTTFSLFINNLQVVSDTGMSRFDVTEGKEEVYKYTRPFFKLDYAIPRESGKVKLPSSQSVYDQLKADTEVDINNVEKIVPGYDMHWTDDKDLNRVVELDPVWLYQYKGAWYQADVKEGE
ncbi:YycH family regulatory protein [Listeria costaricensis]|uniref:YycH family regulatory protein n=1 Tax=Listeria costaricensis TaxID=2026604 RepID=UPI000C07D7BF|nr:two-component system activity regulator YycH [Listeria costaricensis]